MARQRTDVAAGGAGGRPAGRPEDSGLMAQARPRLKTAEVARMLGVQPQTVTRWARRGWLPSMRVAGGPRRYAPEDVEAILAVPGDPVPRVIGSGS